MTKKESIIILFSITLCWSSSYVFIKDIPQNFSVYAYLALTSGVAGIILAFVMRRKLKLLNSVSLRQGLILGVLITASNMFEKLGLDRIPASSASVYASMGIIIVPIILIFRKKYPSKNNLAGIFIILIGILVSNWGTMGAGIAGALYILGSAATMSMYTVLATEYTKGTDPSLLTVLQMLVSAVFGFALWFITEPGSVMTIEWSRVTLSYIFLIAFFSKCYAYLMLMYADKYADAVSVTIVASTEPVVTLVAAVLLPESMGGVEQFSVKSVTGALIISLGAIVAGLNFLDRKPAEAAGDPAAAASNGAEAGDEAANGASAVAAMRAEAREDFEAAIEADHRTAEEMNLETVVGVFEGKEAAEAEDRLTAAALPFMPSAGSIAVLITVMFAILAVSIHVMQFAGGYSQIRPVNAIPAPVGLVFGPVGALACALGNLLGDLPQISNYHGTAVLGFVANFLSAYIPYKVWRAIDSDVVSVHSWRQIGLYVWAAALSCISCALMLGFGLSVFFGEWYGEIVGGIFINNLTFSMALGLPVLIVLTSTDFGLGVWVTLRVRRGARTFMPGFIPNKYSAAVCCASTVVMGITFIMVLIGMNPGGSLLLNVMALLSMVCVIVLCLMQGKEANV